MLSDLKNFLKKHKTDFLILPNSDEFFSEYLPESEKRLSYFSGFTGSNATIVFTPKKSYFFTDGRYTLQAKSELDLSEFEIIDMADISVMSWLNDNIKEENTLGIISKLSSINFAKKCEEIASRNHANLTFIELEEVDKLWQNRPVKKSSKIYFGKDELFGGTFEEKRQKILASDFTADSMLISDPESLCWLLNIRSSDIEFTPILLCYGILSKSGKLDLFVDESRFDDVNKLSKDVNLIQPSGFDSHILELGKSLQNESRTPTIQIDPNTTNHRLYKALEDNGFEISFKKDPIELLKSCKDKKEVESITKTHEVDGLAVTRFLFWVKDLLKKGEEIDELIASEKLLEFRQKSPNFLYPSFNSISGFGSNGAIIHYHPTKKTNKKFEGNSLYLIDSGGQYFGDDFCGTTDVTRTIVIGKPSIEMIENYTRVLKGHIALARAKFPIGTTGAQLDALARFHLWNAGLDYAHGTGHGVGNFLSVHEGPCGISKRSHQELLPGMVLSNEPGFYKEGEYGIRLENLMVVEKFNDSFLCFKTITLAPFDESLIDFKMFTYPEKKWMEKYYNKILERFEDDLSEEEKKLIINN